MQQCSDEVFVARSLYTETNGKKTEKLRIGGHFCRPIIMNERFFRVMLHIEIRNDCGSIISLWCRGTVLSRPALVGAQTARPNLAYLRCRKALRWLPVQQSPTNRRSAAVAVG